MVRILIFLLIANFALADVLGTVRSLMDSKTYHSKQSIIQALFKDESKFMDENGKIDTIAITNTLKQNGLLKLKFSKARTQSITFDVANNPLLFMKIINDSLEELGYTNYLTQSISKNNGELSWTIDVSTQNLIDPSSLTKRLKERKCGIINVKKIAHMHWAYDIDAKNAKLKTIPILVGQQKQLQRPNGVYWLKVPTAKKAKIATRGGDHWFAKVTFFDKHLNPIEEKVSQKSTRSFLVNIPNNAYYMRLDDQFALWNIKHGLSVTLN